ncbi:hypothetical protein V2J09_012963 [Rumex salicifolius]
MKPDSPCHRPFAEQGKSLREGGSKMAVSGDLGVFAMFAPRRPNILRTSLPSTSQVEHSCFLNGGTSISSITPRKSRPGSNNPSIRSQSNLTFRTTQGDKMSIQSINQDAENFLLEAINMSFFERLSLAWKIIFPPLRTKNSSNANIAKQRLKMILFSDRCAVSDEAKQKIVKNIVTALSDFVEIESREKVQLSVSTESDLGTVYSVTVPVRRVKPEYQEDDGAGSVTNIEYKDSGEMSGSVDVRFDFYVPDDE